MAANQSDNAKLPNGCPKVIGSVFVGQGRDGRSTVDVTFTYDGDVWSEKDLVRWLNARIAEQPKEDLQYGDVLEQQRSDGSWVEIGTFARYGQAGQIIGIVDVGGILAEATCDPPIRKKRQNVEHASDDVMRLVEEARYAIGCDFTNNDSEVTDEIVRKYRDSVVNRLCNALEQTRQPKDSAPIDIQALRDRLMEVYPGGPRYGSEWDRARRATMDAVMEAFDKWATQAPKSCLDDKALETLDNFRKTVTIQREKGRPELADAIERLLPTIEGLFMRVGFYEQRFGVVNPFAPSETQQANGLTPAEVSALSYCVARAQLDNETLRHDVVKAANDALERFG